MKNMMVLALVSALMSGCASGGPSAQKVISGGIVAAGALGGCAPEEYQAVSTAITAGGSNWIGAILEGIQCLASVYSGLKGAGLVAEGENGLYAPPRYVADIGPSLPAPLSHGALRRLRVALRLQNLIVK